jgi:hypothetical protein
VTRCLNGSTHIVSTVETSILALHNQHISGAHISTHQSFTRFPSIMHHTTADSFTKREAHVWMLLAVTGGVWQVEVCQGFLHPKN